MVAHTPGPWRVEEVEVVATGRPEDGPMYTYQIVKDWEPLTEIVATVTHIDLLGNLDAHLIAAAPELYEALEAALVVTRTGRKSQCGFCLMDEDECDRYDTASTECAGWMARTALAKARGEVSP